MSSQKEDSSILNKIIWLLRFTIILTILYGLLKGEWETFFISLLALALSALPLVIEKKYRIELPIEFELIIVGFIYFAVFLGEVGDAYDTFFWWDAVLHVNSGIVLAFAGFLPLCTAEVNSKRVHSS